MNYKIRLDNPGEIKKDDIENNVLYMWLQTAKSEDVCTNEGTDFNEFNDCIEVWTLKVVEGVKSRELSIFNDGNIFHHQGDFEDIDKTTGKVRLGKSDLMHHEKKYLSLDLWLDVEDVNPCVVRLRSNNGISDRTEVLFFEEGIFKKISSGHLNNRILNK